MQERQGALILWAFSAILLISGLVYADDASTIKIATWNIENFGPTKSGDPVRMRKIAAILKEFDVIAVQEISNIREQSNPGCPQSEDGCPGNKRCGAVRTALEKYLNEEHGLHYEFVFSSHVKDERYLFIYNPQKVTLAHAELMADPDDSLPICDKNPFSTGRMVRQPFKGRFTAGTFDFILLTAHTAPTMNLQELDGLEYFSRQAEGDGERDIIILGDLNAGCDYLKPTDSIALRGMDYVWIVSDDADTNVAQRRCSYDRIILRTSTVEDFTGRWDIVKDISGDVSDHYVVWAEFYTGRDTD